MTRRIKAIPEGNDPMDHEANITAGDQPTIDFVASDRAGPTRSATTTLPSASGEGGPSPRVGVVAGSGVHLSDETRSLLRRRIRAVALAMSCAFGAFFVRNLGLAGHYLDPLLIAAARDPVEPPSRHRPGVPPDLECVIVRCLAKAPSDRYPDAEALERDLAACAAAEWDFARAAAWWRSHDPRTSKPSG